jgi:hypothetical protein
MSLEDRTRRGLILAVAVFSGLTSIWLAAPLLLIAALLIVWGQEPRRIEEFFAGLPFGNYVLRAMAGVDLLLSSGGVEK